MGSLLFRGQAIELNKTSCDTLIDIATVIGDQRKPARGVHIFQMNPLLRNANSFFQRKGGESLNGKGGVQSRTTGAEGHPVCTSEERARKIGEEAAKVAWPDL